MNDDQHDPYHLQTLLDRRRFLALSAGGAGLALSLGAPAAAATTAPRSPRSQRLSADDAIVHPPYELTSDCVLSEDHFLVQVGNVGPTDQVVAYSWADGQVEAIVRQGDGTLTQVFRDTNAAGGWGSRAVGAGATDMVAGVAENNLGILFLHVVYRNSAGRVIHLQQDPPSSGPISARPLRQVETFAWDSTNAGSLQIATDELQNLLVYCLTPASAATANDAKLWFWWTGGGGNVFHPNQQINNWSFGPTAGVLSGFNLRDVVFDDKPTYAAAISYSVSAFKSMPTLMLYAATGAGVSIFTFAIPLGAQLDRTGNMTPFAHQPTALASDQPVSLASVDYLSSPGYVYLPIAIVRTRDDELYSLTHDFLANVWHWQKLVLPERRDTAGPLRWEPSNTELLPVNTRNILKSTNLLNLFLVTDGTLSVVRQQQQVGNATADAVTPIFNPAVPLQSGVAAVSSQARPSSGDELIVLGGDGNLQVLTKASSGQWTANDIHLPATEPGELSTYRVQLTLADSWGTPVPNASLQLTAARPAVALVDGNGLLLSDQPVAISTDLTGRAMVAIIADGLSAPDLTLSGGPLPKPVTVSPSAPVNTYMTGSGTMNYLPPFTADTLAKASTDAGPLSTLARDHPDVAASAVQVMSGAAKAASESAAPHGRFTLGSPPATGLKHVKVGNVSLSFDDLVDDAFYAIKTGVATVTHVLVSWSQTLQAWTAEITADFDAWAEQVISVTIRGLEDAAHVLNSAINHLGALVGDFVDWLKAHVLKLLADTVALAHRYDGWLLQLGAQLHDLDQRAKTGADQFLAEQKGIVHQRLAMLKQQLAGRSISSLTNPQRVSQDLRVNQVDPTASSPDDAAARWLLQKVQQHGVRAVNPPSMSSDFKQLISDVGTKFSQEGSDFTKAVDAFRDTLSGLVSNPKNFGSAGIASLIDALDGVVDAAFDLLGLIADVVLDLMAIAIDAVTAMLGTSLSDLPLIGPLLKAAGLKTTPTIGAIITLIMAFPAALAYKLARFDANAVLFADAAVTSDRALEVTTAQDLNFAASVELGVWAVLDAIAAGIIGLERVGGQEPDDFFSFADMVCPLVVSCLTFPAHGNDLPFTSPIQLNAPADVINAAYWAVGAMPGLCAGIELYYKYEYPGNQPVQDAASDLINALNALSGVACAALGLVQAFEFYDQPAIPAAIAVLSNVSTVLAVGLAESTLEATGGVSALVTSIVGGLTLAIAAALQGIFGPNFDG